MRNFNKLLTTNSNITFKKNLKEIPIKRKFQCEKLDKKNIFRLNKFNLVMIKRTMEKYLLSAHMQHKLSAKCSVHKLKACPR